MSKRKYIAVPCDMGGWDFIGHYVSATKEDRVSSSKCRKDLPIEWLTSTVEFQKEFDSAYCMLICKWVKGGWKVVQQIGAC